jgi:hypothetical protein
MKDMKLSDFSSDPAKWSDWFFAFKGAVRGADKETFEKGRHGGLQ